MIEAEDVSWVNATFDRLQTPVLLFAEGGRYPLSPGGTPTRSNSAVFDID